MTDDAITDADLARVSEVHRTRYEAYQRLGSSTKVAIELGIAESSVRRSLTAIRAARRGGFAGYEVPTDLNDRPIPEPWKLGKTTIQRTPSGGIERVWERWSPDEKKRAQAMLDYMYERTKAIPAQPEIIAPKKTADALCNLYVMTDCHVGMLAWGKATGAPWDLKIAERVLFGCFREMVQQSPDAKTAVIAQLGDWMHVDKIEPLTPASAHLLDADIRFPKIVQSACKILELMIRLALEKHETVHFICAEGNHDPVSAIWMREMMRAIYRGNKRLTINEAVVPYYAYQHGKTMLAFHHGHKKKPADLPLVFAAREPKMWGDTVYRYGHSGHMHHVDEKGHNGMRWIQHPTLAAPDDYAARGGWISERQAASITYHKEYGEVGRTIVTPEMLGPVR